MPARESLRSRAAHTRRRLGAALRSSAPALLASAAAVWLGATGATAQQSTHRPPRHASPALERAAWYMMSLPSKAGTVTLAAQGTHEGHWRFVNRAGEMFTVGTPDEMKRVVAVLYPTAKAGARVALYVTEDTVYRHRATLGSLPADARLNVVIGERGYRLVHRAGAERLYAALRANLAVELSDRRLFEEARWQLARRLGGARVRVLALEPGGPKALAASPPLDPSGKAPLVDVIDPAGLPDAMGSVSGQMLLVAGRLQGGMLYVRPSSGREHGTALAALLEAAAAADAGLVVLETASTPRRPAGRNRLWRPAVQGAEVADLLSAIAGRNRGVALAASTAGGRTILQARVGTDPSAAVPAKSAAERLSATVADITGRAAVTGVRASLVGAERQRELDLRFLPGIPAAVQIGYLMLLVLGALGMPVARSWWARIWPPEAVSDYGSRSGYWAARTARGLVFLVLFVPVSAVAAAPCSLASQIGGALRGSGWGWRWARGGEPAADAPAFERLRPRLRPAFDATLPRVVTKPEQRAKWRWKARSWVPFRREAGR